MNRILILAIAICGICQIMNGQSPTPFACTGSDGFGYYSSSASSSQSGNTLTYSSSRISKITTSTGNRVTLCTASTIGTALNGLAFNPHDNYLYAVSRYDATQFSGKLYRIGENCQKLEIPVTGAIVKFSVNNMNTIDGAGGNIASATFDLDNNYYVNTSFTITGTTGFTNKLQKIEIVNNIAVVKSTVTLTCPSCTNTNRLRVTDIIFDELTGKLMGSNKETNKLYSIDASTGVLSEIGSTGITTAILGIYKNRDGNVRAISQTGIIYSVNLATGVFTQLAVSTTLNSGNADAASGCYAPPKITGHLYLDANGLTDNTVNGTGSDKAGSTIIYANLVQGGFIVKSDVLTTSGAYQFLGLFTGTYEVQLSTTRGIIGQPAPAQNLPITYIWTGDHTGMTAGNDGTPNGKQNVIIDMGLDVVEVNFGINGIPITSGLTAPSQENPNGTIQVAVPSLTFSDPEEPGINNITIQSIPNSSTQGTLYYNGIAVTPGQNIPSYNPTLLTVDPVDGDVTVSFTFFTTDQAGIMSNVSTVNIPFTANTLPVELIFFRGYNTRDANVLEWRTATEINSHYFSIEKQTTSGDYEEIGIVMSAGNTLHSVSYNFIDRDVIERAYYRLVQVDVDGKTDISPIILIESVLNKSINLYPTIATDYINVEMNTQDDINRQYQILSINGKVLKQGILESRINQLEVSSLENGSYFIKILTGSDQYKTLRFIKS